MAKLRDEQLQMVALILEAAPGARLVAINSSGWRQNLVTIVVQKLDQMLADNVYLREERPSVEEVVEAITRFRTEALKSSALLPASVDEELALKRAFDRKLVKH